MQQLHPSTAVVIYSLGCQAFSLLISQWVMIISCTCAWESGILAHPERSGNARWAEHASVSVHLVENDEQAGKCSITASEQPSTAELWLKWAATSKTWEMVSTPYTVEAMLKWWGNGWRLIHKFQSIQVSPAHRNCSTKDHLFCHRRMQHFRLHKDPFGVCCLL